jgi:hypothetical protein
MSQFLLSYFPSEEAIMALFIQVDEKRTMAYPLDG